MRSTWTSGCASRAGGLGRASRAGGLGPVLGGCLLLVACSGSARTELPTDVGSGDALGAVPATTASTVTVGSVEATTPTTVSGFKSPGEKHPLPGGTVAASYPRVGVRPPRGVAPPPAGQAWALVNIRFCADRASPIAGPLLDPARFRVEVPGQGELGHVSDAPALSKTPLKADTAGVSPGTCVEGAVAYLVGGEGHIEAITYDSGAGLLRWAT